MTHTRTYAIHSSHFLEFLAKRRAKRLNEKFVAQGIRKYRGDRYEVRQSCIQPPRMRNWYVIDWGET